MDKPWADLTDEDIDAIAEQADLFYQSLAGC